ARLPDRRPAQMKRPVARTIAETDTPEAPRRPPRAYVPEQAKAAQQAVETWVEPEPDEVGVAKPPRLLSFLGKLAWTTGGILVSLALGLAADRLLRDLFARNEWLGWVGIALLAVFLVALAAIV